MYLKLVILSLTLILCMCTDKTGTGPDDIVSSQSSFGIGSSGVEMTSSPLYIPDSTDSLGSELPLKIALKGSVVTQSNVGIPGLTVKIKHTQISAVTDEEGDYIIDVPNDSLAKQGIENDSLSMQIEVYDNKSLLDTFSITQLVGTVPTIHFVQRSISGKLLGDINAVNKIEVVISNLSGDFDSSIINLWKNTLVNGYSGHLYFPRNIADKGHSLHVRVYNNNNFITGFSPRLDFPNSAGDIDMPDFNIINSIPEISGNSRIGSTLNIQYEYYDVYGDFGARVQFQWFRNDSIINGAVEKSYIITSTDLGQTLTAQVILMPRLEEQNFGFMESNTIGVYYFIDNRDSAKYNYVIIGDQVWMANNLNYHTGDSAGSWCFTNPYLTEQIDYCDTYGRLYSWEVAMAGGSSSSLEPSGVQGICPNGWHLPCVTEWEKLENFISQIITNENTQGSVTVGKLLSSKSYWKEDDPDSKMPGIDRFGFNALPGAGGSDRSRKSIEEWGERIGIYGTWWAATKGWSLDIAFYTAHFYLNENANLNPSLEWTASVRCLRDER